jgi:hypothetical protein
MTQIVLYILLGLASLGGSFYTLWQSICEPNTDAANPVFFRRRVSIFQVQGGIRVAISLILLLEYSYVLA